METIKTKDESVIEYLEPLIERFIIENEIDEYSKDNYINLLNNVIKDHGCGVFISYDKEAIHGYAIALQMLAIEFPFISVSQFFGETEEIELALLNEIKEWAKKNKIYKLSYMTAKPKRFKKMGFVIKRHTMEMNLDDIGG